MTRFNNSLNAELCLGEKNRKNKHRFYSPIWGLKTKTNYVENLDILDLVLSSVVSIVYSWIILRKLF